MRRLVCLIAALAFACGGKKDSSDKTDKPAPAPDAAPVVPALAAEPLGVDNPGVFQYLYGKGAAEWKKGEAALKARDWSGIAAAAEATLAKDPTHMDALRWLAVARAQQKQYDTAGEPLAKALALDWLRFGPKLAEDKDLADFLASPQGKPVAELAAKYGDDFTARAAKGLWLVARRGPFRAPAKPGVQPSSTRAELFAFDPETRRYLRLTETGGRLAAWLPAPSGEQAAYVTIHKVNMPAQVAAATTPVVLAEVHVGVMPLPLTPMKPAEPRKEAVFKDVRAVTLAWDVGDRLVVTTAKAKGRWELSDEKPFSVDPVTGAAKAAKQIPAEGTHVTVTYDDVAVTRPGGADVGVEADWGERDAAASFRIPQTQKTISLPAGESAARESVVLSPSKARLAFATAADPCAEKEGDQLASLYLVESATGKLKHLGDGKGALRAQWLGEDWLVYEDDAAGLRLVDAAQGKETLRLQSKGGLALTGVGAAPAGLALCKKEKVAYETPPPGDLPPEGEMPPEQP